MKRLISGLTALAACLATVSLSTLSPAQAAPDRNPVIFVHGYGGSASDVSSVKPGLIARGYVASDIHSLDFPNGETNGATAARLKTYVDQLLASTGATKVDIIGFSMGSLSSRYYVKNLGGKDTVEHYVSIAGPNHGTAQASFCWLVTWDRACPQMAPGSTFLSNLNSGDETPGDVVYATWVSECDDVISPPKSTFLSGATNHWTKACLKHNSTPGSSEVVNGIADLFLGTTA